MKALRALSGSAGLLSVFALVIACGGAASDSPGDDDSSRDGTGGASSSVGPEGVAGQDTGVDPGGAGEGNIDPGGAGEGSVDPSGLGGGTVINPGDGGTGGAGSGIGGWSFGTAGTDPGAAGVGTSDPGVGGGSTSDPGVGGASTSDPGVGGGATVDPGTGGGATVDPGTGGATQDPGTGGATQDPGTGGATQDPGTGGATGDPPPDCIVSGIDEVNVIVLNDANTTGADSEGRMYVGGDATLAAGYAVGSALDLDCSRYDLVVGGTLTFESGSVPNGTVAYGSADSTIGSGVNFGCGYERNTNVVDFEALSENVHRYSDALALLESTGTEAVGNGTVTLTGSDPELNVFNIDAADLANATSFAIVVPDDATVLVNISGTDVSMVNMGFDVQGGMCRGDGGDTCHNVLYNFYEAETLTLNGIGVQGSVLAPHAHLYFDGGNIDGQVIVNNLTGGGEFHPYYFTGCIELPWW